MRLQNFLRVRLQPLVFFCLGIVAGFWGFEKHVKIYLSAWAGWTDL